MALFFRKRALLKKMEKGIDKVVMGSYVFLKNEYAKEHNDDMAKGLSGAVIGKAFPQLASVNDKRKEFKDKHSSLIEDKLTELNQYEHLCNFITDAYRVKIVLTTNSKSSEDSLASLLETVESLTNKGIFKTERPQPSADFLEKAELFCVSAFNEIPAEQLEEYIKSQTD
tara:strand:- start:54 stop:563 length:510 start_codon:yes stop_codon:yes gene_type:complete